MMVRAGGQMEEKRCVQCQHVWVPRVENPRKCPACFSRDWEKKGKK